MSPLRSYDSAAFARISQELLAQPEIEHTLQEVVRVPSACADCRPSPARAAAVSRQVVALNRTVVAPRHR
jgi:hypothetical protein